MNARREGGGGGGGGSGGVGRGGVIASGEGWSAAVLHVFFSRRYLVKRTGGGGCAVFSRITRCFFFSYRERLFARMENA